MAIREGRRGRKRERRKESLSWVTKKWGGRSVGGKKSSKEESSLVRMLRYSSIVERKATQTVTLRRTIDKILGRDVVYNAVETLTGTWNISVSMALDVNKRRKRRIRFVYEDGFKYTETRERSMKKKRMRGKKIRFPISITSALNNQASVRLPSCRRSFFSFFNFPLSFECLSIEYEKR